MTIPAPEVRTTRYEVCCVPRSHAEARLFTVHVKECRDGTWVVTDGHLYLSPEGLWVGDPYGANHRYDEQTAIELAKAAAPLMKTFNGFTVADAVAAGTSRNDPEQLRTVPYVSGQHRTGATDAASEGIDLERPL